MLVNLIGAAGPKLTPAAMAARAAALGSIGGKATPQERLAFPGKSGYWTQDQRVVYWDRTRKSSYNNQPGTYVQVGDRVELGGYATKPDGPDIPVTRG